MANKTKKKMNVLNVLWGYGTGGIGKLFLTYAKLGEFDSDLNFKSVCIVLQNCNTDIESLFDNNIEIIPIKSRKDLSWLKKLGNIADLYRPDITFCHGFNGPIVVKVASFFRRSLRVPMVCTYHGLYNAPTSNRIYVASFINKLQAWVYKRYAKTVILVAKYSGKYLIERGVPLEKMQVVYNGISREYSKKKLGLNGVGVSIGMVGRLDAIKGLNYLIEAVPYILKNTNYDFHIYIVGDGPEENNLKNLVHNLKLDKFISFEGFQSNISEWLNSWDVFCLPSLQENHSVALLEAMRAEKAIICTNVGGNPETVVDGKEALLVPSSDSITLGKALLKVIENEDLRAELGRNAKDRFLSCFTEDVMKKKLCNILKTVK